MRKKRGTLNRIISISKSASAPKIPVKISTQTTPSSNTKSKEELISGNTTILNTDTSGSKAEIMQEVSLAKAESDDAFTPKNFPIKKDFKEASSEDKFITNINHMTDENPSKVSSEKMKELQKELKDCLMLFDSIRREVAYVVVGQKEVVDSIILALICNGHCLIEGVPGIGKTLTIRAISRILDCQYSRIQFTPDLLPSDIIGITAYDEKKGFYTIKGPVFANFILADEINRAPPKVQSALLESMQEKQVTIGKDTFILPNPFFVMATQNPVETLGTYALPEAQVDRFLFKLLMKYPNQKEEGQILSQNMTLFSFDSFNLKPFFSRELIIILQDFVKDVYLDKKIEEYIVRIIDCTRNPKNYGIKMAQFVNFGSSPRGTIALFIASKGRALLNGRTYVTPQDVKEVAHMSLRHRITLNYEGQAEEINVDNVIDEILASVPIH